MRRQGGGRGDGSNLHCERREEGKGGEEGEVEGQEWFDGRTEEEAS